LISQFETLFSITLSDESSQLTSTLNQIDARLFTSYTAPTVKNFTTIVTEGISSPSWVPPTDRPTEVRPYVYHALLTLVDIHTELSTHAPPLLYPVISHLNTHLSLAFLSALKSRSHYALPALMQATLDVEFVAQTLKDYVNDKTSKVQGEIYEELDQRTDDGARGRLQKELPEMRAVLKRLREGMRGGFGCFRKPRPGR
jgi:exocyst complex component 2